MRRSGLDGKFPVICVGGSAGGLDAYTRLLRHLPADSGIHFRAMRFILTCDGTALLSRLVGD